MKDRIDNIVSPLKVAKENGSLEEEKIHEAITNLEAIPNETIQSFNDSILIDYNICILNELCSNRKRSSFENALSSLNSVLSIITPSNQPSVIALFDKVADLNFRAHRYEDTINYLSKAIGIEKECTHNGEVLGIKAQFRRRWLMATCLEYAGLNIIETTDRHNDDVRVGALKIENAAKILIGYCSTDGYVRENIVNSVLQMNESENPILSYSSKQEVITIPEIGWNEPCLARTIVQWNDDGRIGNDELFQKMLNDVSHIAAHCLNELKRNSSVKKRTIIDFMQMRSADILMDRLSDDFITCQATLAFERKERFSAINRLRDARQKMIHRIQTILLNAKIDEPYLKVAYSTLTYSNIDKTSYKKDVEQLALINFYLWYFCVIAKIKDYSIYKNDFWEYCKESGDLTGFTYFYVINFKELLLDGFNNLCDDNFSADKSPYVDLIKRIKEAHEAFENNKPKQRIHYSIWDECEFLDRAYQLFLSIMPIYTNPQNTDFLTYKIIKTLGEVGTPSLQTVQTFGKNGEPSVKVLQGEDRESAYVNNIDGYLILCFLAKSSAGSFFYFGNYQEILQLGKRYSVYFTLYPKIGKKKDDLSSILRTYSNKDISNVLICLNQNNANDCFDFISFIIEDDAIHQQNEQHSIYIDYSEVPEQQRDTILQKCKTSFGNDNVHLFDDSTKAFFLCTMFSEVEEVLRKLQKPLDSYMISPITNDVTYQEQTGETALSVDSLLNSTDLDGLSSWTLDGAKNIICTCLPSQKKAQHKGVVLHLERFRNSVTDCSGISHLFVFNAQIIKSTPTEREDIGPELEINYFDIGTRLLAGENELFSDSIYVYDTRKDLQESLKYLSRLAKVAAGTCEGDHCCSSYSSFSDFILREEKKARALREYLFSYIGVLIEKSSFLLFQNHVGDNNVRYYLCVFDENSLKDNRDLKCSYCRTLKDHNGFIDSWNTTSTLAEHESLLSLKNRIRQIDRDEQKEYFFISYRGNRGLRKLCEPVYRDVVYLQKKYPEIGFCIDTNNFGVVPRESMEDYITNERCIGAIIYLSPEYFLPEKNGKRLPQAEDYCLEEAELFLQKEEKSFHIFPVLIEDTLLGTQFEAQRNQSNEFVKSALIELQRETDERLKTYKALFCDNEKRDYIIPNRTILSWQPNGRHFERQETGRNDCFVNIMETISNKKRQGQKDEENERRAK